MFLKIKDRRTDGRRIDGFTDGGENLPAGPVIIMIARLSIFFSCYILLSGLIQKLNKKTWNNQHVASAGQGKISSQRESNP